MKVIADGTRRARKAHGCGACLLPIAVGTMHYHQTCVADGRVYTWHEHVECREIGRVVMDDADEWPEGWLLECVSGEPCPDNVSPEAAARWLEVSRG